MARVNIYLEDDAHTKAKVIAVLKGVTLNDYFAQAIDRAMAQDKDVLDKIKGKLETAAKGKGN